MEYISSLNHCVTNWIHLSKQTKRLGYIIHNNQKGKKKKELINGKSIEEKLQKKSNEHRPQIFYQTGRPKVDIKKVSEKIDKSRKK